MLKSLLSVDIETKLLNKNSFIELSSLELRKSSELDIPCSLAIVKIDDFIEEETLFEGDPFPMVLKSIVKSIHEETDRINYVGRLSKRIFGIFFFNSATKDVFLWAEKLRIKIARKPIAVVSKQTTFTISVGIATATGMTDIDEVLHNAELALNKATEKGGNAVKSI
jgi:diguanylate cyclase (GGDEF)-like protein